MTPWFDIHCTECPNLDSVKMPELAFDQPVGPCTLDEDGPCQGRMVRTLTAPAIGKGSSGEPIRPAS